MFASSMNDNRTMTAISYMLISTFLIALAAILGKQLLFSVSLPLLLFLRFACCLLIVGLIYFCYKKQIFKLAEIKMHFLRSFFVVLNQYAFFYCLLHSNALYAVLFNMTSPLFIPIITRLCSPKTKIHYLTCLGLLIGFMGVVILLHPNGQLSTMTILVGLGAGFCNAISQRCYYQLSKQYNPLTSTLYLYSIATTLTLLISLLLLPIVGIENVAIQIPLHTLTILLIMLAVIYIISQLMRGQSYKTRANQQVLTPLLFTSVIFSGLFDWFFYDDVPTMLSIIGICLIIGSAIVCAFSVKQP